ncbi:uncharacterized protein DNG_09587 [Cephalotrichum gorgonifer]|uniref:Translation initiation factor IF-3 n=1 Tax=Cephalotrichum gorgonifer TaxID=2041049 RepID=A0AAE8N7Z7_9PEZI|nr:uncharacterized protein DNG_09587 [Cephalotrichum gorgonifer]
MIITRCTSSLRTCLHRAWLTDLEATNASSILARPRTLPSPRLQRSTLPARPSAQLRPLSTTPRPQRQYNRPFKGSGGAASSLKNKQPSAPPTQPEIAAPKVMIAVDGKLSGPHTTSAVLQTLNPRTHLLRVVSPGTDGVPICKVIDLQAEARLAAARAEKTREAEAEKGKVKHKIVEINWAIAENDLALKERRVREFLESGHRVEIVMLPRRKGGKRKATREECEGVMRRVREVVGAVEGTREAKNSEGEVGKTLRMYVEKQGA